MLGEVATPAAPSRPRSRRAFPVAAPRRGRSSGSAEQLGREQSNMSKVAEKAGLERTHLYRKLKQLNIRFSRRGEDPAA
jgi:DNA-binding NtrC family response regulator